MSKILRRPMFRGGPVDSRGTGITSGLMNGGRVGLQDSFPGTVGEAESSLSNYKKNLSDLSNLRYTAGLDYAYPATLPINTGAANETITEKVKEKVEEAPQKTTFAEFDAGEASLENFPTEQETLTNQLQIITKKANDGKFLTKEDRELADKYGIIYGRDNFDAENKEEIQAKNINLANTAEIKPDVEEKKDDTTNTLMEEIINEGEELPEVDAKTAVAENKKLFAELLGGDKARSQDIGDMLLRFAAAPGSTTGEKFQTYLDAESKAGKGRLEKINETAAALAINDYVAGKRSKEDIAKLKEVATFKESLGNKFTDNLIKIAGPGTIPTASHIESALRTTYPGRNVTRVKSTDELEISDSDKGTFILEEDTKRAFLITGANSKKQVY